VSIISLCRGRPVFFIIRLEAKLQPNIRFTLRRVLAVFTRFVVLFYLTSSDFLLRL